MTSKTANKVRINCRRANCAVAWLLCTSLAATAAAPDVKHFYPAGAKRGTTTVVNVVGKLGEQRVFAWCSRDDVQVAITPKANEFKVTTPPNAAPGVCWIRLYDAEGASAVRPFVVGLHPELQETEPNNWLKQAHQLDSHTIVVNGRLSTNEDVDTFAVNLSAGQTLVASMTANRVLGSPMDALLQIVSADGFVLEQNDDDQEFDPRIVFTAPADGKYFVRTFAFPAQPNQSIRFHSSAQNIYRLTLTTGPFIDHTWPLAVDSGAASQIALRGWNLDDSFNNFPLGGPISGDNFHVFDPRIANTVRVPVVPHPVAIEPHAEASSITHEIPVTISGRIAEPGEIDEHIFAAVKGQKLVFEVESRSIGHPLDPVLMLLGPDGKTLGESDDVSRGSEDATLSYQVGVDGQYRIRVFDRFGNGGFRYVYRLTATHAQPAVELTVAANSFTLPADKPLEIEVKLNRTNGFADELAITAVDLPAGVNATPAASAKDGDTSKSVKLTLQAGEGIATPGTFRIVATTSGEDSSEFAANSQLSAFNAKISKFWLNVPNPKLPKYPVEAQRPE